MEIAPVVLEGQHVRLEPLSLDHVPQLCDAGLIGEIFRWFPWPVTTPDEMRAFVEAGLREQNAGTVVLFATIDKGSKKAVGSTRFLAIDKQNRRDLAWQSLAADGSKHRSQIPHVAASL